LTETVEALAPPGQSLGFRAVLRNRFLLRLLVDKEIQVRYRGSALGLLWSYIKPAVQFGVFYLAMGVFLQLNRNMPNYAIYLFSGMCLVNFFMETFGNAARSIVGNGHLIKKIFLPRELFPVSSLFVAMVHFFPQVVVLLIACLFSGWHPSLSQIAGIIAGTLLVGLFGLGLGLFFATADVFFRDAENIVDLINMVATWLSPVLYTWYMVQSIAPGWVFSLYMANPITIGVELFHFGFWLPTTDGSQTWTPPPHLMILWTPVALIVSILFLVVGDLLFKRFEGRFAQEL